MTFKLPPPHNSGPPAGEGAHNDPCLSASSLSFPRAIADKTSWNISHWTWALIGLHIFFFLFVTSKCVEYIKIAFRLVLVYWWNSNTDNYLNLFTPYSFFFISRTSKFESSMGRIDECLPSFLLSPFPPWHIHLSCMGNGIKPVDWTGLEGLESLDWLSCSRHTWPRNQKLRWAQGNSCRNKI